MSDSTANNHIFTADGVYKWVKNDCEGTVVFNSEQEDYEKAKLKLKPRFDDSFV